MFMSSISSPLLRLVTKAPPHLPCPEWINGTCPKPEAECQYLHGFPHPPNVAVPLNAILTVPHCADCGKNLDEKVRAGHKIAVLTGCEHLFCNVCARRLRIGQRISKCKRCEELSQLSILTLTIPRSPPEKEAVLRSRKAPLEQTECRYGEKCSFGKEKCIYKH